MLLDHDTKTAVGTLIFLVVVYVAACLFQRQDRKNRNRFVKYKGVKNAYNGK